MVCVWSGLRCTSETPVDLTPFLFDLLRPVNVSVLPYLFPCSSNLCVVSGARPPISTMFPTVSRSFCVELVCRGCQ